MNPDNPRHPVPNTNRRPAWQLAAAAILVLGSAIPSGATETSRATGRLSGTLTARQRIRTKGPTSQKDVVVYLEPVGKPTMKPVRSTVAVTQKGLNFVPHVLAIPIGTDVEFHNEDKVVHNLFSKSDCCLLDEDMSAEKMVRYSFDTPGVATVVCRIHPEMSMHLVVLTTPHFTQSRFVRDKGETGRCYRARFELSGLPPGEYVLKTWNKKLRAASQKIEIRAGKETRIDVELE